MREAVEAKLRRDLGASQEAAERLRNFNATQTYRGRCRVCGAPWTGTLGELPRQCLNCGLGAPNGE
jgi:hypothetical protein